MMYEDTREIPSGTASRKAVDPASLPEAEYDTVGREQLNQFIDLYCKGNTVLAACATDAFYWFNKVAAAQAVQIKPTAPPENYDSREDYVWRCAQADLIGTKLFHDIVNPVYTKK